MSDDQTPQHPTLTRAQFALMRTIVHNAFRSRSELWKSIQGDVRRSIDDECGYDKDPGAFTFYDLYDRGAIPRRVVEVYPKETWQVSPLVYEKEDNDQATEFEKAWDDLGQAIQPETSWHNREKGSSVWEYLLRADVVSGIGRYGVILIGLDDIKEGEDLSKPVDLESKKKGNRKLLFLRVFPEHLADITQWEESLASPRFGRPKMYSITFNDPRAGQSAVGLTTMTANVHWTRVIHIAEGLQSGEVFGTERMRPVLNNLRDLNKIYGAAAEGFWKACFTILTAETHPELGGDVEIDDQKMKDMFEEMMNGLQRTGVLTGMSLKSTAPSVSDPTPQIDKNIEAICIALGCPVRIFKGSERGELASAQDDDAWNDRLKHRQQTHVTPRVIVPFIDRLIAVGVLPEPAEGYTVEWPDLTSNSDKDKASVALTWTQAISAYTASGAPQLITWFDFLTYILKVSDDEAEAIVKNAEDAAKGDPSDIGSPLIGMVGGITAMIELFKQAQAGVVTEEQLKAMIATFFKLPDDQIDELIADGIEVAPPEPTTIPHGAETGTDPNLPGPVIKLPKPPEPSPRKSPTTNFDPGQKRDGDGKWTKGAHAGTADPTLHPQASGGRRVPHFGQGRTDEGLAMKDAKDISKADAAHAVRWHDGMTMVGSNGPNKRVPDATRPDLDEGERGALQKYSYKNDGPLNARLRGFGDQSSPYGENFFNEMHGQLQSAFAKTKPFKPPVTVVRGMKLPPEALAGFVEKMTGAANGGKSVSFDGYMSTAIPGGAAYNLGLSSGIPSAFQGNVSLSIKAVQGLDMKPHSRLPGEGELLLNHKSKFKVGKVTKKGKGWHVELEQLPHDGGATENVEHQDDPVTNATQQETDAFYDDFPDALTKFVDDGDFFNVED